MANNIIIGIDPDITKSGVARYDVDTKELSFTSLDFPTLLEELDQLAAEAHLGYSNPVVVVEASWVNKKANYHGGQGFIAQKIAYKVGLNHDTGIKIVEMCRQYGITVVEQPPLKKKWKKGKISAEEFNELTGWKKRSSQDMRDAALLALHYAGKL